MKASLIIASREFKNLFLSPLAWTILGVLQFILAFLFLTQVDTFNRIQNKLTHIDNAPGLSDVIITPLFGNAAIILLLVTPLLTMRIISEERRNNTLSLLLTAPVSNMEIILGKFLGVFSLQLILTGLITLMPLSLLLGGNIDFGKLVANILALTLLLAAFTAIGVFMSSLTSQPTVAAISTFGALLFLWVLDWTVGMGDQQSQLFSYLSILRHFQTIQSGLISTKDICYFLLFITTFILFTINRLDSDRLQK